jgi:hypothetical protein
VTLPVRQGGINILVQRTTFDRYNDRTYTDHHIITGCLEFIGFSTTGRINPNSELENSVTDRRTVYAPFGADIQATDRIILLGQATVAPAANDPIRKTAAYQVLGKPMDWENPLTGWSPGTEVGLEKVT